MLIAMSSEDFDAPTQTPVGQARYRRLMEIRVFDCWMHEQDIRQAITRPGHEDGPCVEVSIDKIVRALGFVVGKQASVPDGSTVTVDLVGARNVCCSRVNEDMGPSEPGGNAAATLCIRDLDGPIAATSRAQSASFANAESTAQ